MKKMLEELYRIYPILNRDLFDKVLPDNISITIEETKPDILGFFQAIAFSNSETDVKTHRIVISYNRLCGKNNYKDLIKTFLHELAHCYNYELGIKDTSRSRHNEHFKSACNKIGLHCPTFDSKLGYSETEYTEDLLNYIDDLVDSDACTLTFKPTLKKKREVNKKPKYVYNCECGKEITSKTPLNVSCSDCQSNFELNEDKSKNIENS